MRMTKHAFLWSEPDHDQGSLMSETPWPWIWLYVFKAHSSDKLTEVIEWLVPDSVFSGHESRNEFQTTG